MEVSFQSQVLLETNVKLRSFPPNVGLLNIELSVLSEEWDRDYWENVQMLEMLFQTKFR